MALPIFHTDDRDLQMLQSRWTSELNPVLGNPTTNPLILKDIQLQSGDNVINHRLGRKLQGWILVDQDAPAQLYRAAAKNDLTLTLNSSAPTTISLAVF